MAARVGSISDNASGGWYSYRASKAAVFQLAKSFDLYLHTKSGQRAMAVVLHPGTVRTDFTKEFWGGRGMLEPAEAAGKLLEVLMGLAPDAKGGRGEVLGLERRGGSAMSLFQTSLSFLPSCWVDPGAAIVWSLQCTPKYTRTHLSGH
ncbi:uncharacterized protein N7515_010401 [Penicillium bovifimosum]|uniref:C-factor n=1 Tax=Penicillium bovifimosum TaxID=126998 RepID=A0A9W9GEZ4_9EURO|nr:uncharacterized protein N7515_010401 [Penicillium bovifimosum]KAJ5118178.1 hypothetical protein N7515_010401 [Penicillium bovifimosum]